MARLVFDGPPKGKRNGENAIPYSSGGGYVRAKHRNSDTGRYMAERLLNIPSGNFLMVADDIAMAVRSHRVRPNLHHERTVP